jgi:hypothetical protein
MIHTHNLLFIQVIKILCRFSDVFQAQDWRSGDKDQLCQLISLKQISIALGVPRKSSHIWISWSSKGISTIGMYI